MKKSSNIIATIVGIISAIMILWFLFSWIDIISDNTSPNPQHSEYNLITMVFGKEVF